MVKQLEVIGAIISFLLIPLGTWVWWSLKQRMVTHDHFGHYLERHDAKHGEIEERLAEGDRRFITLDERLKVFPTAQDITALRLEIAKLNGDIGRVLTELNAIKLPVQTLVQGAVEKAMERGERP